MYKNLRTIDPTSEQYKFYKEHHLNQTYDFVLSKLKEYSPLKKNKMKMKDVLSLMDSFVDPSDPDTHEPNSIHAYQTAERIRKDYPDNEEFQVCGLIHDLGKVLYYFGEPAWAVVGDTFPVGCRYSNKIICYDELKYNPDSENILYSSLYGVYKRYCGIKNLKMTFGHDEYLYLVLKGNNHNLNEDYVNMIRFHSFYPWLEGDYKYFMTLEDEALLEDVKKLNSYDLYSKEDDPAKITNETRAYYDKLLDKFFPHEMSF